MPTSTKTYYAFTLKLPHDLDTLLITLGKSKHTEPESFFNFETGQQDTIALNGEFKELRIKDGILRGVIKFENVTHTYDLQGKHYVSYDTPAVPFFIGITPKEHLIINSDDRAANRVRRIISSILYNDKKDHIFKIKLTNEQYLRLRDSLIFTPGTEWRRTGMDGLQKMAFVGTDTRKPIERAAFDPHLKEYISEKIRLHDDNNWTIWVNRESGKMSCLNSHDPIDFVHFIQKKILTLSE